MFDDPMVSLMIMLLLCFMGMLVMFLFVIRNLSNLAAALREGFVRQQAGLADVEQQLMDISFNLRTLAGSSQANAGSGRLDGPPADLRELFDSAGKPTPDEIGRAALAEPPVSGANGASTASVDTSPNAYAYPSAAGFDQSTDEDLLAISLGMDQKATEPSAGQSSAGGLEIKLDR